MSRKIEHFTDEANQNLADLRTRWKVECEHCHRFTSIGPMAHGVMEYAATAIENMADMLTPITAEELRAAYGEHKRKTGTVEGDADPDLMSWDNSGADDA